MMNNFWCPDLLVVRGYRFVWIMNRWGSLQFSSFILSIFSIFQALCMLFDDEKHSFIMNGNFVPDIIKIIEISHWVSIYESTEGHIASPFPFYAIFAIFRELWRKMGRNGETWRKIAISDLPFGTNSMACDIPPIQPTFIFNWNMVTLHNCYNRVSNTRKLNQSGGRSFCLQWEHSYSSGCDILQIEYVN